MSNGYGRVRWACKIAGLTAVLALMSGFQLLGVTATAGAEITATVAAKTQRMSAPNLNSHQDGWYNPGDRVTLVCSARGQAVQGHFSFNIPNGGWDELWYKTSDGHFVADVDIETGTLDVVAPDCGQVGATPPAASTGETIAGQIACINSASPVGVWVQAESSASGWAAKDVPIELGGVSKVNYSYTLDHGGRYQVHVGCGGTPENWGQSLKSGYVSGSRDFVCNDMNELQGAAWAVVRGQLFGAFGRNIDLTQDIRYGECEAV